LKFLKRHHLLSTGLLHLWVTSVLLTAQHSKVETSGSSPAGISTRVHSTSELLLALDRVEKGDSIIIKSPASLDLTGLHPVKIPSGVVVLGDRGFAGSPGPLMFTTSPGSLPLLLVTGDSTRISGLRLVGPDSSKRTLQMKALHALGRYYSIPVSRGIQTQADHLEVDNCEISGWSHAGIFLDSGAVHANIHNNYIHHNQRSGLGYGVALKAADARIYNNHFDWNRHAIAGTGEPGTSYHAHDNTIGPNASGHAFDMHGHWQNKDSKPVGGDSILIENNVFHLTNYPAVMIRGTPRLGADIRHNTFNTTKTGRAVVLKNGAESVNLHNNTLSP